jgi:hypothetical protein
VSQVQAVKDIRISDDLQVLWVASIYRTHFEGNGSFQGIMGFYTIFCCFLD